METFLQDLKHSIRMFVESPGFTIAAVAALALGIGANTAIFSVVNAVLLKPLTYPEPDRIVEFLNTSPNGSGPGASVTKFNIWRQQTNAFQDVAAYNFGGPGLNLTGGAFPEQVQGIHVSADYFRLFGAPVALGRTFTADEDRPLGGRVVVLSDGIWRRRFGADPRMVGKSISLGGEPYTVVGILGPAFATDPVADLWMPFQFDPNSNDQAHYFLAAGRFETGRHARHGEGPASDRREPVSRQVPWRRGHGTERWFQRPVAPGFHRQRRSLLASDSGRCRQLRVIDRLRQCRQSAPGPRHWAQTRDRDSRRSRRRPWTDHPSTAD